MVAVGYYATRHTGATREEYFVASRTFGTVVLFFAIFATHMTAVALIGGPSMGHELGVGGYGIIAIPQVFLFALALMTIGVRVWKAGKRYGHITPSQVLNHRLNSRYLGLLLMGLLTFWTVPYVLVGLQGSGVVFEGLTDGAIPYWAGSLIIAVVVGLYVTAGGMRGTGWTNAFQGAVFMAFLVIVGILVPLRLGGPTAATEAVIEQSATHVNRAEVPLFEPRMWVSVGLLIPVASVMFPHLYIRFMTGRSTVQLKNTAMLYPIAAVIVWIPAVLIGFWSLGHLGPLDDPDFALPMMMVELFPLWVAGIVLAAVLAAIMSSLDGQVLALSTLFTQDVVEEFADVSEKTEVLLGRVFVVLILAAAWIAAQITTETVVDVFLFASAGYALIFFPAVAPLYWKGINSYGVYAGLIFGFVGLWVYELGWIPEALTMGLHVFLPLMVVQVAIVVVVSLATPSDSADVAEDYDELYNGNML